eukprot:4553829-Prymnesium_polylepis.1
MSAVFAAGGRTLTDSTAGEAASRSTGSRAVAGSMVGSAPVTVSSTPYALISDAPGFGTASFHESRRAPQSADTSSGATGEPVTSGGGAEGG